MTRKPHFRSLALILFAMAFAFGSLPSSTSAARRAAQPAQEKKEDKAAQTKKEQEEKAAQAKKEKEEQKKLSDQKKFEERAQKNAAKRERDYQKIRQFADNLYKTDPTFKLEVDHALDNVRRNHGDYAFMINTLNQRDERITYAGDKIKSEDTLYDNLTVMNYVNRVGQSLVPDETRQLLTFRVTLNPIPEARSLSTGTVYISSGLLSLIDNEAQLAYILGHEIAHIKLNHWFEDALVANGAEEFNETIAKKRSRFGKIAAVAGGVIGGAGTKSFGGAMQYSFLAAWGAGTALKFIMPDKVISWDERQEDEADRMALDYMLNRNYDPREVPKLFARLEQVSGKDPRARMGFMGETDRLKQRGEEIQTWLKEKPTQANQQLSQGASNLRAKRPGADPLEQTLVVTTPQGKTFGTLGSNENRAIAAAKTLKEQEELIKAKLASGEFLAASGEFDMLMADLKRDNGVRAFYYDMFAMAAENLTDSIGIRGNDPYTHFYYGKLLHATARDAAGKTHALEAFRKAVDLDRRNVLPEPRLYLALTMMAEKNQNEQEQIVVLLKDYVGIYQQEHAGSLPPNMDMIYAYMKDAQEETWAAHPVTPVRDKPFVPARVAVAAPTAVAPEPPREAALAPQPPPVTPKKEDPKKPVKKPGKP